jgi:protein-histidine pros-kinase
MKLRLQYRYALTILPLIAAVSAVFLAVSLYQIRDQAANTRLSSTRMMDLALSRRLESEGRSRATLLADSLINDIYNSSLNGIYQTIGATRDQEDISYVYVFDRTGRILHDGTEENASFGTYVKDPRVLLVFGSHGSIVWIDKNANVVAPITLGSNVLGAVWLGMSTKPIAQDLVLLNTELDGMLGRQVWQYVNVAVAVSLFVMALGTVIVMLLARTLSRPIEVISQVTARIGKGQYDAHMPVTRSDEIGALAEAVTRMSQDLKQTTVSKLYVDDIIETMLDALVVVNPDATIKTVNKAACELLGYRPDELVGQPVETIMKRDAAANGAADIAEPTETVPSIGSEDVFVAKDGREISVDVSGAVMRDVEGHRDCVVYAARDITKRKRAEAAVEESQRRFAGIVEFADDAIISIDDEHRITLFNESAERTFGYEAKEVLGQPIEMLLPASARKEHPQKVNDFAKNPDASRVMGEPRGLLGRRKDGSEFPAEVSISKLEIAGKHIFTAILRDITERKRAEETLQLAMQEAVAANRAKSNFLANMSHELRTPLNAIIGFSDMIKNGVAGPAADGKFLEYIHHINESGTHLLGLINDILDLSKIEVDKLELHEERVDVARVVQSCVTLVNGRAREGGLTIACEIPDGLPLLRADGRKLRQIVVNILSNAVKFTDDGGAVTVKASYDLAAGIVLQITDTGIGIAPQDIPKTLEPFSQVDSELSRKYEGTGLGLPLTKSLVELHGGSLDLRSTLGVGTTVTVRFPPERIIAGKDTTEITEPAKAEPAVDMAKRGIR